MYAPKTSMYLLLKSMQSYGEEGLEDPIILSVFPRTTAHDLILDLRQRKVEAAAIVFNHKVVGKDDSLRDLGIVTGQKVHYMHRGSVQYYACSNCTSPIVSSPDSVALDVHYGTLTTPKVINLKVKTYVTEGRNKNDIVYCTKCNGRVGLSSGDTTYMLELEKLQIWDRKGKNTTTQQVMDKPDH